MSSIETFQPKNHNEESAYDVETLIIELETSLPKRGQRISELDADIERLTAMLKKERDEEAAALEQEKAKATPEKEEPVTDYIGEVIPPEEDAPAEDVPANPGRRKAVKKIAVIGAAALAGAAGVNELLKPSKKTEKPLHEGAKTHTAEKPHVDSVVHPKHEATHAETTKPAHEAEIKKSHNESAEKYGRLAEKMDVHFFENVLDDGGRLVYLDRITNPVELKEHPGYWVMVNKKKAEIYIIDGSGKLARSGPVLIGREVGENKNDQDMRGGHLTTTSTYTVLSDREITLQQREDYGKNSWRIEGTGAYPDEDIFIHGLLGEKEEKEALRGTSSRKRHMSHGCVRDPEIIEDQKLFTPSKTRIAILPEKEGLYLNVETGKAEPITKTELADKVKEIIDKSK